jgi:hypothetical protein
MPKGEGKWFRVVDQKEARKKETLPPAQGHVAIMKVVSVDLSSWHEGHSDLCNHTI